VGDLRAVEEQLEEVTGQVSGELRIVAPMSFGQRRLAPLVARFALEHPKLRVTLRLEDRETDIVAEGIDLAVRIAYPSDSSLVSRPIASVPRYFCASPGYLARRGTPRAPRDLLCHDCLHYNVISEREEWTFGGTEGDQSMVMKGVFCSNNGEVLAEAALQGLGITLLPDFIVEDALADGRLVRVLEGRERSPLTLSVLYPSRQHVPAKTRLFIDHLVEQFG
jgi:DNA-binding transcriptional LysR family regulator